MTFSKYLTPIFCIILVNFFNCPSHAFERDRSIFEYNNRTKPVSAARLNRINSALDVAEENLIDDRREEPKKFYETAKHHQPDLLTRDERQDVYTENMTHPPEHKYSSDIDILEDNNQEKRFKKTIEAGPIVFNRHFSNNDLDQNGVMSGFHGEYTVQDNKNDHVYRVEGEIAFGDSNASSEIVGKDINGSNYMGYDVRGLFGKKMDLNNKMSVVPYGGVGFRFARDQSTGRNIGQIPRYLSDIDSDSRHFYIPIGVELTTKMKNNWSLIADLGFDFVVMGEQKNHYDKFGIAAFDSGSGQGYAYDAKTHEIDGAYAVRGSTKFMRYTEKMDFFVEPFFRYFNVPEGEERRVTSRSGTGLWFVNSQPLMVIEPSSEITEVGLKLGFHY